MSMYDVLDDNEISYSGSWLTKVEYASLKFNRVSLRIVLVSLDSSNTGDVKVLDSL